MIKFHILLPALLLPFSGQTFGEKQPQDAPVTKQEGDLVLVEAFDAGLVRKTLVHKVLSPDKNLFAGYYRDGFDEVISIHETKSGKQIKRIVGHGDDVRELKFTPDGAILASWCENSTRRGWTLWNVESGELIVRLPVPPTSKAAEKSPDTNAFVQDDIRIVLPVRRTANKEGEPITTTWPDGGTTMIRVTDATGKEWDIYFDRRISSSPPPRPGEEKKAVAKPETIYLNAYPGKPGSVLIGDQKGFRELVLSGIDH